MLLVVFPSLCQQIMPLFVTQRDLYEARERPAKTYSWQGELAPLGGADVSIHAVQHHDRDSVAVTCGTLPVCALVLPDRSLPQRRANQHCP